MSNQTITLTFGEQVENHVGMQQIGSLADNGFSLSDLKTIKDNFKNYKCYLYDLKEDLDEKDLPSDLDIDDIADAYILIIRNGCAALTDIPKLYKEVLSLDFDKQAFMKGRVVNKIARYNLCFSNNSQEPDYEEKKGRIIAFDDVPYVKSMRENLPKFMGKKTKGLYLEANLYYDINKTYIGWHGDTERKRVVGIRLGETFPLHYQWFYKNIPFGDNLTFNLKGGDIYIMSEKAVGFDWKKKNIATLRHSAGDINNVALKKIYK